MGVTKTAAAVVLSVLVLMGAACDTNLRGDAPPPSAEEGPGDGPLPLPPPDPGPTMSDEPVAPGGLHEMYARSGEVQEGQPYVFELDARCSFDHRVDFHGRLWEAADKPRRLKGKRTAGTMVLVNAQMAEFTAPDGTKIRFLRHIGKKLAKPCDPRPED